MKNVVDSTGVDMQAHDVAMHETDDKIVWDNDQVGHSHAQVSVSDQVRLRQLNQCPVKVLGHIRKSTVS